MRRKSAKRRPNQPVRCSRTPNRLMTEYFRRVSSSARRSDDNCSCQFEEEQRSDAKEIGEKTTESTCSVF